MLRTALKPVWLLGLLLTLVLSGVFIALSWWQFSVSESAAPPPLTQTEMPVALTEHFQPGAAMLGTEADQVVVATGHFQPEDEVLVQDRLLGERTGYWVVTALTVDGAPDGEVIPVVRGWTAEPTQTTPAPEGQVEVTGRLLPAEGPEPGGTQVGEDVVVTSTLATSELVNLWDTTSYAGFLAAHSVVPAQEYSTLDALAAGTSAEQTAQERAPLDVDARSPDSTLEPVDVGPQPQETQIIWMNVFYGVEWVIFAGFAFYLWWRFVRDDHLRSRQEEELDRQWEQQWRTQELARRREEARLAKEQAERDLERYHQARERQAVATARRLHLQEAAAARDASRTSADGAPHATEAPDPRGPQPLPDPTTRPSDQEDQ